MVSRTSTFSRTETPVRGGGTHPSGVQRGVGAGVHAVGFSAGACSFLFFYVVVVVVVVNGITMAGTFRALQ